MKLDERIVIDPRIMHGQPVIRGTRVPLTIIVGGLAGGMSFEDISSSYGVTREDISAALCFANELIHRKGAHFKGQNLTIEERLKSKAEALAVVKLDPV